MSGVLSDIFVTWDGATIKFESSNQIAGAIITFIAIAMQYNSDIESIYTIQEIKKYVYKTMRGGKVKTVTLVVCRVQLLYSPAGLPQQLFVLKNGKSRGLPIRI